MRQLDYFLAERPRDKEIVSGDAGVIKEFDSKVFIGIIDVLGHGQDAYKIALICQDFLEKKYRQDLVKLMENLDKQLRNSRGAVVGLCLLDLETSELKYVGVGNITVRIFGSSNVKLIPNLGIVGYAMPSLKKVKIKLDNGAVLVLHTDGVQEHFELEDYPKLLRQNAETIAKNIVEKFGKGEDDATCIALRYRK